MWGMEHGKGSLDGTSAGCCQSPRFDHSVRVHDEVASQQKRTRLKLTDFTSGARPSSLVLLMDPNEAIPRNLAREHLSVNRRETGKGQDVEANARRRQRRLQIPEPSWQRLGIDRSGPGRGHCSDQSTPFVDSPGWDKAHVLCSNR